MYRKIQMRYDDFAKSKSLPKGYVIDGFYVVEK